MGKRLEKNVLVRGRPRGLSKQKPRVKPKLSSALKGGLVLRD